MPATFLPTAYLYQPVIFATGHFSNPFSPPRRLPTSHFCQLATFVNRILLPTRHFFQADTFYQQILLPLDCFFNNIFSPPGTFSNQSLLSTGYFCYCIFFCISVWVAVRCSLGKSVWMAKCSVNRRHRGGKSVWFEKCSVSISVWVAKVLDWQKSVQPVKVSQCQKCSYSISL